LRRLPSATWPENRREKITVTQEVGKNVITGCPVGTTTTGRGCGRGEEKEETLIGPQPPRHRWANVEGVRQVLLSTGGGGGMTVGVGKKRGHQPAASQAVVGNKKIGGIPPRVWLGPRGSKIEGRYQQWRKKNQQRVALRPEKEGNPTRAKEGQKQGRTREGLGGAPSGEKPASKSPREQRQPWAWGCGVENRAKGAPGPNVSWGSKYRK